MSWRACWVDPDSQKERYEPLPAEDQRTEERRRGWAVRKSQELADRRRALDGGAVRRTDATLEAAVQRYFDDNAGGLSKRTALLYRRAADNFLAWAKKRGIARADELTKMELRSYRAHLMTAPKRVQVKGQRRLTFVPSAEKRAPVSVNGLLRHTGAFLHYGVECDLYPRLNGAALALGLEQLDEGDAPPEYMSPERVRVLLRAALRHDDETRVDCASIAPFTAFVLLSGMRLTEAVVTECDWVHEELSEIRLPRHVTKTRKGRSVVLSEVSPALHALVAAQLLRRGRGGTLWGLSKSGPGQALRRLRDSYGAPKEFTYQLLRSTCSTVLTNAPGIFGAASAWRSAKQLGHSVQIAEADYAGIMRGVSPAAKSIEAVLGIEQELALILRRMGVSDYRAPSTPRLRRA